MGVRARCGIAACIWLVAWPSRAEHSLSFEDRVAAQAVYGGDPDLLRMNGTYTQTRTCAVPYPVLNDFEVPLPGKTGLGEDSQGVPRPNTFSCH